METAKNVFKSWWFWVIIGLVVISLYFYKRGVTVGTNIPPPDVLLPPTAYRTQGEKEALQAWQNREGTSIANDLGAFFKGYSKYFSSNAGFDKINADLQLLSDAKLVIVYNLYKNLHHKTLKGTLVVDIRELYYFGGSAFYDRAVLTRKRLENLGGK